MLIRHLFFFGADSTRPDVCRRSKTSEFLQRGDILYLELLLLAIGLDSKFFFFLVSLLFCRELRLRNGRSLSGASCAAAAEIFQVRVVGQAVLYSFLIDC